MRSTRRFRTCFWGTLPVLILLGIAASLLVPTLSRQSMGAEKMPEVPGTADLPAAQIATAVVEKTDLPLLAEATGYLEPWRQVELSTEIGGKVTWRGVEEGQWIQQGQVVLRLDRREREIELAETEAELLKAQAAYAVSYGAAERTPPPAAVMAADEGTDLQRSERLFVEGLLSRREVLEVRRRAAVAQVLTGRQQAAVRAATTGLAQLEQQVERARLALARTALLAPFRGRVADLRIEVGQQLSAGQTCLYLLDDSRLKVDVKVLEAAMVSLREGAPARVRIPALDDAVLDGRIHTINPRIDPETGSGRVTVALANPEGALLPGLFAYVRLQTRRLTDRLVVPQDAVLIRQGRELVFRVEGGRARWTYVTVGARSGDRVEIVDGLSEGDTVAVEGHFALAHDAPVEVVAASGPGGAPGV